MPRFARHVFPKALCAPLLALVFMAALALLPARPGLGQTVRVTVPLDQTAPQARQQALEHAFAAAVAQDALRILPAPLPPRREEALRRFLAPGARDLVMSYQETPSAKVTQGHQLEQPGQPAQPPQSGPAPLPAAMDYDIEVNRPALRTLLQRLGLLSAGTRVFALRLGPGVAEGELGVLAELNALMGLERAVGSAAPLDITLEKLPQGYYKAVLRHAPAPRPAAIAPIAADGPDIPAVWQNLWGMLFTGREFRPGGPARSVHISGWRGLDGVLEFDRLLSGLDDCVQDAQLNSVDLRAQGPGGVSARWSVRVVSPDRLAERLREILSARGLTLAGPEALFGSGAAP